VGDISIGAAQQIVGAAVLKLSVGAKDIGGGSTQSLCRWVIGESVF